MLCFCNFAKKNNINNSHICEIGAGSGRTANQLIKSGAKSYTIYDILSTNIIHSFYLGKIYPKSISFFGEKSNKINILPYFQIYKTRKNQFDLTINQDSIPEIDHNTKDSYYNEIFKNTKKFFISINQEDKSQNNKNSFKQSAVINDMDKDRRFERVYREHYILRDGYAAEIYKVKK